MLIVYPFFLQTSRVFKREVLWYNQFNWIFHGGNALRKSLCLLPALALTLSACSTLSPPVELEHPTPLEVATCLEPVELSDDSMGAWVVYTTELLDTYVKCRAAIGLK